MTTRTGQDEPPQDIVELEWAFLPANYFDTPVKLEEGGYQLRMDNGKAIATIDGARFDREPTLRQACDEALRARFDGAQLKAQRGYELGQSTLTRRRGDSRTIEVGVAEAVIASDAADVVHRRADGQEISNSRTERAASWRELGDLFVRHGGDPVLRTLRASYGAALNDPRNELVHLYEVVELLSTKLGGRAKASQRLGVDLGPLGNLSNDSSINESRHRGQLVGASRRDATPEELEQARAVASAAIEAYARSL